MKRLSSLLRRTTLVIRKTTLVLAGIISCHAIAGDDRPDPEVERASFKVADGMEVTLFASDPMIAKPIQMNFDTAGRLWVASSSTYPQIRAGETADDKVIILEDKDGDGKAETSTVFASGLLIPTGIAPGDGGCYVANSIEIVHLKDTDGDGKADLRRSILSGFGTEDTHHIIHTFRWGPDGSMFFNQSIYIHSHVETPYGPKRLNAGGIWRFRPKTQELEVLARGWINTWGHAFDAYGQSFATDGAGGEGINYFSPGFRFPTATESPRIFHGLNPGQPKFAGLEIVSGRQLPDDWQGDLITNDFRAHRVCHFKVSDDGAGFSSKQLPDLIVTKDQAFRPVDIKMGPDGAIYIADWYNPIIQHGEVDFFDPRRDHGHGRIWRVTAKGRALVPKPKVAGASLPELFEHLKSPEGYTRDVAKRELRERNADEVIPALDAWLSKIPASDPQAEHTLLEALWVKQGQDKVDDALLQKCLSAKEGRVRAAAVRVLAYWGAADAKTYTRLSAAANDELPRVRLEALRAAPNFKTPEAFEAAIKAVDKPMDKFTDYGAWLTATDMKNAWMPAFQAGKITLSPGATAFAMKAVGAAGALKDMIGKLGTPAIKEEDEAGVLDAIFASGGTEEMSMLLDRAIAIKAPTSAKLIRTIVRARTERNIQLKIDGVKIKALLDSRKDDAGGLGAALRLASVAGGESMRTAVEAGVDVKAPIQLRRDSFAAMADLGGEGAVKLLKQAAGQGEPEVRIAAIAQLARLNAADAAALAVETLATPAPVESVQELFEAFLNRNGGKEALTAALKDKKLPADVVKMSVRIVRSITVDDGGISDLLKKAAPDSGGKPAYTREDIPKIVAEVSKGDPARGEEIFRRLEMQCQTCHSIGGMGGKVGPDIISLGASAPVDYIVEALIDPNAKVKEGYNSTLVLTNDGTLITGIIQKQDDSGILVRTSKGEMVSITKSNIKKMKDAGSLMPAGLMELLTHNEVIDLVRFLTELGKPGPYAASSAPLARKWQTLAEAPADLAGLESKNDLKWRATFSQVAGDLPKGIAVARTTLEASVGGAVSFKVNGATGLKVFLNGKTIDAADEMKAELPKGTSTLVIVIDKSRATGVKVELGEVAGSSAKASFVNQ